MIYVTSSAAYTNRVILVYLMLGTSSSVGLGLVLTVQYLAIVSLVIQPLAINRPSWRKRGSLFTEHGIIMRCVRKDQTSAVSPVRKGDGGGGGGGGIELGCLQTQKYKKLAYLVPKYSFVHSIYSFILFYGQLRSFNG